MNVDPPAPGEVGWFAYPPDTRDARPWRLEGGAPRGAGALDPSIPVKLMPEYAVELPLWNYDREELGLPTALLDDLADWQATFDAHFDPGDGWGDNTAVQAAWSRRAEELVTRLRRTLPDGVPLEIDLWPLERPEVDRGQP